MLAWGHEEKKEGSSEEQGHCDYREGVRTVALKGLPGPRLCGQTTYGPNDKRHHEDDTHDCKNFHLHLLTQRYSYITAELLV